MIYSLGIDYDHITKDNPYDAKLIKFSGWEDALFNDPEFDEFDRAAPAVVEFVGNLKNASCLAFLETTPTRYLLISKQMVRVLGSVRPFNYELIPTRIYAREIEDFVRDEHDGGRTPYNISDPKLYTDEFAILKLRDKLDCLDYEHTIVDGLPFVQNKERFFSCLSRTDAEHYELREPEGGFPPVFLVRGLLFYCYSEEAKQACERAGLRGLAFQPLP